MRLFLLSDTHMTHDRLAVPACDLLIHAGDFTRRGSEAETRAFVAWLGRVPAARVLVAGNHDLWCEREPAAMRALCVAHGVTYLEDEEATVAGLRIWGSPITPRFRHLAFNRARGPDIRAAWARIPAGLDVLVTHGPARGVGDRMVLGPHVGCDDLREAVLRARPRLHVFGHIHEAAGEHALPGAATRSWNVATRKLWPGAVRPPVVVDL